MEEKIIQIFSEVSGYDQNLLNEETLIRDTRTTSLMIIQIMVRIEQALGIEIDDEDIIFSKINKLGDLFSIVNKKL